MSTLLDVDTAAWVRLAITPGLGPAAFLRLLQVFATPEQVLRATSSQLAPLLKPAVLQTILATREEP